MPPHTTEIERAAATAMRDVARHLGGPQAFAARFALRGGGAAARMAQGRQPPPAGLAEEAAALCEGTPALAHLAAPLRAFAAQRRTPREER